MKNLLLSLLLLLVPYFVFPQQIVNDTTRKTQLLLDVSVGASIPVGNYSSSSDASSSKSKSGFAATGMFLSAALSFRSKNDFSLGLRYTYQKNPFRNDAAKLILAPASDSLGTSGWTNHYLMPGIFVFHQSKQFSYDVQALVGLIMSSGKIFKYYSPLTKLNETSVAFGWGFGLNVGFGYNISPKVTLKVNAGYLAGYPSFSKEIPAQFIEFDTVTQQNLFTAPVTIKIKKVVSAVNVGAGLLIKL